MKENNELTINDWIYKSQLENGQITFNVIAPDINETPTRLFKLFTPNSYAVDGLCDNYLYGNHPSQFNDLFDCHKELIVSDDEQHNKVILDFLYTLYGEKEFDGLTMQEIHARIIEGRFDLAYITFGLSCLTSNPNNVLMWAYYGNNQGYMVEYDCTKFPANFHGPFPINYMEELIPKSIKKTGAQLAVLYQSCIKSKVWSHEDEWRYLMQSENGKPLTAYGTSDDQGGTLHNRKFTYPKEAVKSISLGNRFFHYSEILEISEDHILKIKFSKADDQRMRILNYAINENIQVNYGLQQNDFRTIKFRHCELEKKNNLEFWFH